MFGLAGKTTRPWRSSACRSLVETLEVGVSLRAGIIEQRLSGMDPDASDDARQFVLERLDDLSEVLSRTSGLIRPMLPASPAWSRSNASHLPRDPRTTLGRVEREVAMARESVEDGQFRTALHHVRAVELDLGSFGLLLEPSNLRKLRSR